MIPEQFVEITISNQGAYFSKLGYQNTKQGSLLKIPVSHLKKNSNKKVVAFCDLCNAQFAREFQLLNRQEKHFCYICVKKENGKKNIGNKWGFAGRNITRENHPRWNPNKPELQTYTRRVHWLTKKTYDKYKQEINPFDFPRSLCGTDGGYQLDHIISIKEGFEKGISPEELSQKENLQMITWKENRNKSYK